MNFTESNNTIKVKFKEAQYIRPVINAKEITENGIYNASEENADGFSPVSVNIDLQTPYNNGYGQGYEAGKQAGYADGKQAEYDRFWDIYQTNGNKQFYSYAFYYWPNDAYNPKYPIYCNGSNTANQIFRYSKILDTKVDITIYSDNSTYVFADSKLKKIKFLHVGSNTTFKNWFYRATELEELTIGGTVTSDLDVHWSTELSKTSINSLFVPLSPNAKGKTVTISKIAKEKAFTDEEWKKLLVWRSNWTISLV